MKPTNEIPTDTRLFNKASIKKYFSTLGGYLGITGIYSLFSGNLSFGNATAGNNPSGPIGNNTPPGIPPQLGPRAVTETALTQVSAPPSGNPPSNPGMGNMAGMNGAGGMANMSALWPLWGYLVTPSLFGIIHGLSILGLFSFVIWNYFKNDKKISPFIITLFAYVLLLGSNLIQGWDTGIVATIGARSEIYTDAIQITNIFTFISQFESLQSTLSIHAQTQPPGAVIMIYLLYLIFQDPGVMAIALSIIATFGSGYFLNGIFSRLFDKETAKYGLLMFLILPAVWVYYLANIYAIVATFAFGVFYFYLKLELPLDSNSKPLSLKYCFSNKTYLMNFIGALFCFLCLSFLTYLFVWEVMFLGLFELLKLWKIDHQNWIAIKKQGILPTLKIYLAKLCPLIILGCGIIGFYLGLYLGLNYNYMNSLMYASYLENPDGFMLIANPVNYFVTRLQDVLDILYFFGPILTVILYRGLKSLKTKFAQINLPQMTLISNENSNSTQRVEKCNTISVESTSELPITSNTTQILVSPQLQIQSLSSEQKQCSLNYIITIAAIFALLLLFLTGAAKKGETARICLFILPFLLIPVLHVIKDDKISKKEKVILLLFIITQSILTQLFGYFIW